MRKVSFSELINMDTLKKMTESLYAVAGIPIGIIGVDSEIYISAGWQDICVNYHRAHPHTLQRCIQSDGYINEHIRDGGCVTYKCLNNLWDIAIPIIVSDQHVATLFLGQFFYDDEVIDEEYFRNQALKFGFDEKEYMAALKKVPIFSRQKVEQILTYYSALVTTLAESGMRLLESESYQKKLKKSEEYINTVFNSMNDGILIHDMDGNIIDANKTCSNMFGYSHEELISMNIRKLVSEGSPYSIDDIKKLINIESNMNPLITELITKNKNGASFWIEVSTQITKIDARDRFVVVIRDISERKQAEQELYNKTVEMDRLRTEFFANISHELRTPLNIILGSTQIIGMMIQDREKEIDREKIMNNLNIEKQNCLRLLRLINNLIDSTRLDSGDFDANMVNCDIVSLVENIVLSTAEYIRDNELQLIFDTDIEEKIIACDLEKVERIILNLLSNSVKFTNHGGSIFVNIYDGKDYITITVEDTGIGIPEDKLGIIFDRFRQVDKSFTRRHEGSGIGLAIVKSLVELHGGSISVKSKYGSGTEFSIKLPVKTLDTKIIENKNRTINAAVDNYAERIKFEFSDI